MTDNIEKEIKYEDLKKDFMFSTNQECDWLTNNDPADAFADYVSDNLDDNNFVELFKNQPKVYVYKPEPPFQITAEDIFDFYTDNTGIDESTYSFDYKSMEDALANVNALLSKMPRNYTCIGYVRPSDLENDWKECFEDQ